MSQILDFTWADKYKAKEGKVVFLHLGHFVLISPNTFVQFHGKILYGLGIMAR